MVNLIIFFSKNGEKSHKLCDPKCPQFDVPNVSQNVLKPTLKILKKSQIRSTVVGGALKTIFLNFCDGPIKPL